MKINTVSILLLIIIIHFISPQITLLAENREEVILVNKKQRDMLLKQQLDSLKIVIKTDREHIVSTNDNINNISSLCNDSLGIEIPQFDTPARPIKTHPHESIIVFPSGVKEIKVYIKMWVDTDGSVKNVKVIKSSGFPGFDNLAIDDAYKWIFTPAQYKGKPVRAWVAAPIIFKLDK